jgi:DNA-directed RNA polymerase specialized sigma24 family protein
MSAARLASHQALGVQPLRRRGVCALLIGLIVWSALSIRPAAAGPKAKLLGDLVSAAIGLAAVHYGKQALIERGLEGEEDPFRRCLIALTAPPSDKSTEQSATQQLVAHLQWNRRLDKGTAEDIAYSALVDLCIRHSSQPYANLVAAYHQASVNRANNFYSRYLRRYATCENVALLADRCQLRGGFYAQDEGFRLRSQIDVARRAWCGLSGDEQQILIDRAMSSMKYSEIGTKNGLTARQAHDRYHNTLRRVQAQVRTACPED